MLELVQVGASSRHPIFGHAAGKRPCCNLMYSDVTGVSVCVCVSGWACKLLDAAACTLMLLISIQVRWLSSSICECTFEGTGMTGLHIADLII